MIKVGDVCKFIGGSDKPFVVTRITQETDSVIIDGVYSDGWTLSDVEVYNDDEWKIAKTGRTCYTVISSLKIMEDRR